MPIYTFRCPGCGSQREVICKPEERDGQQVVCPRPECLNVNMAWAGVEGHQAHRPNGKYRLKFFDGKGKEHEVAHHGARRSDS